MTKGWRSTSLRMSSATSCGSAMRKCAIQIDVSTRITSAWPPPRRRLGLGIGPAQPRQPPCRFPLDQRPQRLAHQRRLLAEPGKRLGLSEQVVIQGKRGSHAPNIASNGALFNALSDEVARVSGLVLLQVELNEVRDGMQRGRIDQFVSSQAIVNDARAARRSKVDDNGGVR